MATNVSVDSLMDAMTAQIALQLVPTSGNPLTTAKPVYSVQRYMGAEFTTEEGFKRGIAGRCPAVRVRHAGTRSLRTTIGRRTERVESSFSFIIASDSQRGKDDRKTVLALTESVRNVIGSRAWSKQITPMRFRSMDTLRDDDRLLAYALTFSCKHRVDYSVDPGNDTVDEVEGTIVNEAVTYSTIMHAPTLTFVGATGSTGYDWALIGIDANGLRTLLGEEASTDNGPATLNSTNYAHLTWAAVDGIASYEIHRTGTDGTPSSLGLIGTTTDLFFNDTGIAASADTAEDPVDLDLLEVYP